MKNKNRHYDKKVEGSILVTDEWSGYNDIDGKFKHIVVKHNAGNYASDAFSSNKVENFWSHLKRSI